ncbi:RING-type domain-containing protein [Mycena venus]|uniref:RING-type domain-containing protein n=1 Tax=Mycena venus TaxID=2733690 RepID=A0A8H7CJH5_9AGAR|nr:RING-type domain-containing protein [Mycena venus]
MPLVLHESSSCDVCLDGYSSASSGEARVPHAIPCGHIFCRTCLLSVEPTNCPLCRKAFNRERIKKLHVEPPESDAERDLLHRLALAFDAETDAQARISDDLNSWLGGRPEDDHLALRKAWAAFKIYNKMSERRQQDKQKIRRSERQIQQLIEDGEYKTDTHKAVESSLLAQVSELTAQIADLEAQVNPLRNELAKYQHTANPLPPPPEPVPLDRFPTFARAAAESKEGYAAYFTPGREPPDLFPSAEPAATDKGKGKGKGKALLFINPTGNVIIPGATPSQRVIPGSDDAIHHAYHTHAPASAYVDGYASGYGQGYGAANGATDTDTHYDYNYASNHASTSAYQLPPRTEQSGDSLENAIGSLRLWGGGAAEAAIAQPVSRPHDSAQPVRRHAIAPPPSHTSTADDVSISSQTGTSYARPSAFRRSTVQTDGHHSNGHAHAPSAWHPPSIYANAPPMHHDAMVRFDMQAQDRADREPITQESTARRATHERNRLNRQSYSSWGTVHTNDSPATGTRGSMSDLGEIANFPLIAQAPERRNSVSSQEEILDRELVATPRQDGARGTLLGFTAEVAQMPALAQRPAHAHSYSLPANALPTLGNGDAQPLSYDSNNSLQRVTRMNNRQRAAPRRFPQLPANTSEFGQAEVPPPMANALGLDLGMEAAPAPMITAPTPRVQMGHFLRSWSLDPAVS